MTGYLNYALGRVYFHNPVTGGFVTEAAHLTETNRFLAPMDQTHTLTGGVTYRHAGTGLWLGERDRVRERHADGPWRSRLTSMPRATPPHAHVQSSGGAPRVPGHFTAGVSFGVNLMRDAQPAREADASVRRREHHEQRLPDRAGGRVLARAVFNSASPVSHGEVPLLTRDDANEPCYAYGV